MTPREVWPAFIELRGGIDVTQDDTPIDGLTAGLRLWDYTTTHGIDTSVGPTRLPVGASNVEIGFYAEAPDDDTASFGCKIWGKPKNGPVQLICDVTGASGAYIADMTNVDNTTRVFYDDLTVADTSKWLDVTTRNLLSDGMGLVCFSSRHYDWILPLFYNVGDGTEADRIKALMRTY